MQQCIPHPSANKSLAMAAALASLPECPSLPGPQAWTSLPVATTSAGVEGAPPHLHCCSLPPGLSMDPGFLAARSTTLVGSLQPASFLLRPRGTVERSSRPQLCDTPQAPMAGPAARWLHAKVTQSLGGQRGAAPPASRQLSFAMLCPSTGLAQLFPPMHQLHPSSSGPPKEQLVWVLGDFFPAGQLRSLAQGAGWCGVVGYLQEAFLTPGFSYGGLLNFELYSHCLGISTLQLGQGPVTQKPIFRCGARRLQQEWSPRVI